MMSGGVDSSVAAFLLQKQGYQVVGCFIKGYNLDGCQEKDAEDARRVAEYLNIPFYAIDLEKEYKKLVVDYTIRSYKEGLTPNPDVMCNKEIKFGLFLEKALELGADYVATGHYVRLGRSAFRKQHNFLPARKFASPSTRSVASGDTKLTGLRDVPQDETSSPLFSIYSAKDKNKDQSYFLWTLTQDQLRYCLFPIGNYLKPEVRKIAKRAGLPTAEKKDSQGICFLGKISMEDFLKKYIPVKKGTVLNLQGKKIGEHQGIYFYTIGQRHIGIANRKPQNASQNPFYVAEKDVKTNSLIMVEGENNPALYKKEVLLANVNFIDPNVVSLISTFAEATVDKRAPARRSLGEGGNGRMNVLVRIRYRQPITKATLILEKGPRKSAFRSASVRVLFENPQKAVAAGQSVVLYNGKGDPSTSSGLKMLGGGVIKGFV